MLRIVQFVVGALLFITIELLKFYLPQSVSAEDQSAISALANFINENIFYLRTIMLLIMVVPAIQLLLLGKRHEKWLVGIALVIVFAIVIATNQQAY